MKKYVFLIVLIMFIGEIKADHYYVNPDGGNDGNSGKSETSAWRSLAKINPPSSFKVNDTISFKCGTRIYNQTLIPPRDSLVFNSYGTGARPIIDGDSTVPCVDLLTTSRHHITFNGIRFVKGYHHDISLWACNNVTFDSCNIDSSTGGNYLYSNLYVGEGNNLIIRHCTLNYGEPKNDSTGNLGIYLDGTDNSLLEYDTLIGNYSNIRLAFGDDHGMANNDTIRYCVLKNPTYDNIDDDGSKGSIFYYNLFQSNKINVYLFTDGSRNYEAYVPLNSYYYNNTFITNGAEASTHAYTGTATINGMVFKNNIYYLTNANGFFVRDEPTNNHYPIGSWTLDNNLYFVTTTNSHWFSKQGNPYSSLASWQGLGYDGNSKSSDPLFTNIDSSNYRLKDSSSAVFSGVWVSLPPHDIRGDTVANPPDIGAYQNASYLSGTISTNTTKSGNVNINGNVTISSGVNLTLSAGAHFKLSAGAFISGDGYMIAQSTFKIDVQTWDKALFRSMSGSGVHPKLLWGAYPNPNYGTGGYGIYCSFGGTPFIVDTLSNNTFTWTDSSVTIGGRRAAHYYVVALNQNNQESGQSNSLAYYFTPDKRLVNNSKTTDIKYFNLAQNYPNPFNPTTEINYQMPKAGFVSLIIYDILGREVSTLVNEYKIEGSYDITFNASGFKSGIYICRLKVNDYETSKKMILLK